MTVWFRFLRLVATAALIGKCVQIASACSLAPGYETPTNFELVKNADSIIIATVDRINKDGSGPFGKIVVKPTMVLKGEIPTDELFIRGTLASEVVEFNGRHIRTFARRSLPYDLYRAHPDAFGTACQRYTFDKGMKLVLFLQNTPEGPRVIDGQGSRALEDVPSDNALWVEAVKFYVMIAKLDQAEQQSAMHSAVQALRKETRNEEATLLADDIERQLAGCVPADQFYERHKDRCQKPQWAYNLLNYEYLHLREPVEVADPSRTPSFKSPVWMVVLVSLIVGIFLLAICIWLIRSVYRKQ